jgi:hypothetical protein
MPDVALGVCSANSTPPPIAEGNETTAIPGGPARPGYRLTGFSP